MEPSPAPEFTASPVFLRYVAALRGIAPGKAGEPFTYVQMGAFDPEDLLCLAASNPEGQFYGFHEDSLISEKAQKDANARGLKTLTFGNLSSKLPARIDFLVQDETRAAQPMRDRTTFFETAEKHLVSGGLLCLRYRTCFQEEELFRFLIGAVRPELSSSEIPSFLDKLAQIGASFFKQNPACAETLAKAQTKRELDPFFENAPLSPPTSTTFDVMAALLPKMFAYVGDGVFSLNYIDFSVPAEAQAPLLSYKENLFYETFKDIALCRKVRCDIWVRLPAPQTADPVQLFDVFTFGIPQTTSVPETVALQSGGAINFRTPLFAALMDLMTKLPMGIGDFLSVPLGKKFDPDNVLSAVQTLVAAGIAQPLRGRYETISSSQKTLTPTPQVGAFLNTLIIQTPRVRVASPVAGMALTLSAREALVLQAIVRVGLTNAAGALYNELCALASRDPALAATLMDHAVPSHETADIMLRSILEKAPPRWYAYGLMAA